MAAEHAAIVSKAKIRIGFIKEFMFEERKIITTSVRIIISKFNKVISKWL